MNGERGARRGAADLSAERGGPEENMRGGRPLRGATWLFTFIAVVGGLHVLAMIGVEVHRYLYNRGEIVRLKADVAALDEEIADLQATLIHGQDERFREQLARLHGFVYPHEVRYVTVPD